MTPYHPTMQGQEDILTFLQSRNLLNYFIMSKLDTRNVKLKSDVTIERVDTMSWGAFVILIMGQTGVGKSTFIESIAGHKMGISKDQLEGFTQDIAIYRLVKTRNFLGFPIYLIDTPGFSDRKISEFYIIKMVQKWMKLHKRDVINRILYLDRITDIRMSGSKGRRLEMFKALTGSSTASYITFTTTMWDNIWQDAQIARAEERFTQLKSEYWKEFIDEGAHLGKFTNTRESALQIIDDCMRTDGNSMGSFAFVRDQRDKRPLHEAAYGPILLETLFERITGLEQKLKLLEEDLALEETKANEELYTVLLKEQEEATQDYEMFQAELRDFDPTNNVNSDRTNSKHSSSTRDALRISLDKSAEKMKNIFHRKKKDP